MELLAGIMAAAANGLGAVHGGGWAEGVCKLGLNPKGLEQVGAGSWDSWESTLERPEELTMRGVWSDDTSGVSGLHSNTDDLLVS